MISLNIEHFLAIHNTFADNARRNKTHFYHLKEKSMFSVVAIESIQGNIKFVCARGYKYLYLSNRELTRYSGVKFTEITLF